MVKPISRRKLLQRLKNFGFDGPFSGGKHLFMIKGEFKLHIPNLHQGDISRGLLREILRQANISPKEWEE